MAPVLPIRKKLNKLKTDVLSDPSENRGLRAKCLPQTWRDKQMQSQRRSAHLERKSLKP